MDTVSFRSILFDGSKGPAAADATEEPPFFTDLNLDQVLESLTRGREEYELRPFFYMPLHDVAAVRYRHDVLRDLEKPEVLDAIRAFAQAMRQMREHLAWVEKLRYALQKEAWFLAATETYCEAVQALDQKLAQFDLSSSGFRALSEFTAAYGDSERFASLVEDSRSVKAQLEGVRYSVRSLGGKVTVSKYEGEVDYAADVEETFAKFRQGAVESHLVNLRDLVEMDHVEERIVGLVARLYPDVFGALREFCTRHRDYLDATVARFDREIQFYIAYLELVEKLKTAGLPFCYPNVSARSKRTSVEETFDVALANKLVPEGETVVRNDLCLVDSERIIVVTGPNNGGKTTFARMFGQLHHLAALGLPVPGSCAKLFLPDRIFSHFEREEDIETLRGKFEDELVRVHQILEQASSDSVIVMNESFSSTTLNDALYVGTEVINRILELGALAVYVTFVDELTSLSDATVSMVSQVVPENPAQRTFKLIRKPADGLAYAWAIAEKYGLTYDRLLERVG